MSYCRRTTWHAVSWNHVNPDLHLVTPFEFHQHLSHQKTRIIAPSHSAVCVVCLNILL